ncbi:hypothetical protein HDU83_002913 [Entophlyctis luteolus]|nr:hypothetical protein HDU83_002913 [Entophlyctis luteolus]
MGASSSKSKRRANNHAARQHSTVVGMAPTDPLPPPEPVIAYYSKNPYIDDDEVSDSQSPQIESPDIISMLDHANSMVSFDVLAATSWDPNNENVENFRTYHPISESSYLLPDDDAEQSRVEFHHYMLRIAFDGDVVCPAAKILLQAESCQVLDVGCAQGSWMHSVSAAYPKARYFGVDISSEALTNAREAENITFSFGNVLEKLPFESNTFDFVHQRQVFHLGVRKDQTASVIRELMRVAKPAAWIELVELDLFFHSIGPKMEIFHKSLHTALIKRGIDPTAGTSLLPNVQAHTPVAGNIDVKSVSVPLNWGATERAAVLGRKHALDAKHAILALEDWMHRVMGMSREHYRVYVDEIVEEWAVSRAFMSYHCVCFQVRK